MSSYDFARISRSPSYESTTSFHNLYFNQSRTHASLDGSTPAEESDGVDTHHSTLENFTSEKHCGGLFELPMAA